MVKIEIVTTPISFRQYNQFDTDFIQNIHKLSMDYLHIMYSLSTGYLQVLLYKGCILTICRLYTDYIEVLHNSKVDYFGTENYLFLVKKNEFYLYRIDYCSKNGCR